jgi:PAS domain S-box-containing protein
MACKSATFCGDHSKLNLFHHLQYLESVRHDPWSAAKWFAEAERLEAQDEDMKNQDAMDGLDVNDPELRAAMMSAGSTLGAVGDRRAIIVINAQGIMQLTNQVAHDLFGYAKAEMRGKNVSMLIPAPLAQMHTSYIRNYITTGRGHVVGKTIQQMAMHKNRRSVCWSATATNSTTIMTQHTKPASCCGVVGQQASLLHLPACIQAATCFPDHNQSLRCW